MRPIILSWFGLLICASASNAQTTVDLRANHTVPTGDYAAFLLSEAYRLHVEAGRSEITPVIMFNPENMNVIDFHIISSEDDLAVARVKVDETVAWIRRIGMPLLERRISARMSDANFRVYYLVPEAAGSPQALLAWHDGVQIVPGRK